MTDVYHHVLNCDDDGDDMMIQMIMLMLVIIIIFTFVVCKIQAKFSIYSNHSSVL